MEHEVAVVGLGCAGAAALERIAARGVSVVGLDALHPPHGRGSSHGGSRVFRLAYFEHAAYVGLLGAADRGWSRLESETGRRIVHRCGVLLVGYPGTTTVERAHAAASQHGIPVTPFDGPEIRARWPLMDVPNDAKGLLEPHAGFVVPEAGISAHLEMARRHGADIRCDCRVHSLDADDHGVRIDTGSETLHVGRVVVAAGAWSADLLASCGLVDDLVPHRKVIAWARPRIPKWSAATMSSRFPCWLVDDGDRDARGVLYGVPAWPGQADPDGVKFGWHGPGTPVDPDDFDRTVRSEEIDWFAERIDRRFPGVFERPHAATTCLYTMSSDEHFVVDRLPDEPRITIAGGLSGHGYKFSPALGEALADLSLDGGSELPVDFLSLRRFRDTLSP